MPVVGQGRVRRLGVVAPRVRRAVEAAAGGQLPLCLGGQRLAGPCRVALRRLRRRRAPPDGRRGRPASRTVPRGVASWRRASRSTTARRGAGRPVRWCAVKTSDPGCEVLGGRAWEVRRVEWALGDRDVAGVRDERGEVAIGDLAAVDPEAARLRPGGPATPRDSARPSPSGTSPPRSRCPSSGTARLIVPRSARSRASRRPGRS